jgi:hypothetical protein
MDAGPSRAKARLGGRLRLVNYHSESYVSGGKGDNARFRDFRPGHGVLGNVCISGPKRAEDRQSARTPENLDLRAILEADKEAGHGDAAGSHCAVQLRNSPLCPGGWAL